MGNAKQIILKPIARRDADALIRRVHYSGTVVVNSQVHIGVFYHGRLEGAIQFGPSLDKRRTQSLVSGTSWNGFLELNRLAFTDVLPRNSESRALGIALRMLRRYAPHVEWVLSFADGVQCGDGTIYRAAGFVLTQIKKNKQILSWHGRRIARKTLDTETYPKINGRYYSRVLIERGDAVYLPGFQFRYVYFLNPAARSRLTVPIVPFSEIDRCGAGIYRGTSRAGSIVADAPDHQLGEDGAAPIPALQTLSSHE